VLLLSDPVADFWLQHVQEFKEKPFKSVTRGVPDLDAIAGEAPAGDEKEDAAEEPGLAQLIEAVRATLGPAVKDVRPSKRLTESPVCLVAEEGDMDVSLERLLRRHGRLKLGMARVLEINPDHEIIRKLGERARAEGTKDDGLLKDAAHLLLDQARIADGDLPPDPAAFARRMNAVLRSAL
jgi:molecular chaperone HtpG